MGGEDPLEEGMETHSSILAWRIPWTEELGGLQSTVEERHGWSNWACTRREREAEKTVTEVEQKEEYIVRKDGQQHQMFWELSKDQKQDEIIGSDSSEIIDDTGMNGIQSMAQKLAYNWVERGVGWGVLF